jgi:hypothetical protein
MLPQTAIRIIGGALIVQSLLFYAFATPLTLQIFPGAGEEATHVGVVMRRGLAAMSFLAGLVIFLVHNDSYRTTKRVLFGCAIGFAAISLSLIKNIFDEAAVIPLPAVIAYSFVAIFAMYIAMRRRK